GLYPRAQAFVLTRSNARATQQWSRSIRRRTATLRVPVRPDVESFGTLELRSSYSLESTRGVSCEARARSRAHGALATGTLRELPHQGPRGRPRRATRRATK